MLVVVGIDPNTVGNIDMNRKGNPIAVRLSDGSVALLYSGGRAVIVDRNGNVTIRPASSSVSAESLDLERLDDQDRSGTTPSP